MPRPKDPTLTGGYGAFSARDTVSAHRFSWEIHNGPIPRGIYVCHHCDNPPCVNPDHLRLLTNSDNAKNRYSNNRTHCDKGHEFNEENTYWEKASTTGKPYRACRVCGREYVLPNFVAGDGDPRHGTLHGYNKGKCRCDLCTDARRGRLRV